MTIETVPIESIQPDPANLRRHPERNLAAIKGSLARFGQQRPIVVDGRGIILAGNGTYAAARELGWAEIRIVRTDLTGAEATAYAIADNRTSELAEWDDDGLARVLDALASEDADLAQAAGYSPDELAKLIAAGNEQATEPEAPEDFTSYDESIDTDYRCPSCGYCWSGKPK